MNEYKLSIIGDNFDIYDSDPEVYMDSRPVTKIFPSSNSAAMIDYILPSLPNVTNVEMNIGGDSVSHLDLLKMDEPSWHASGVRI